MKKLLLTLSAVSALAVAVPAAAQYPYQTNVNANANLTIAQRIAQLDARVDAGVRARTINWREARDLRAQVRELRRMERQYSYNGLTRAERTALRDRLRNVRQQVRLADGGNTYYDRAWAYDDNNAYQGQGGLYEPVDACETMGATTTGIGGVIQNLLGGNRCLRIGQRVPTNLYAVPYQYSGQFRDGGGVYYRSDGRLIYQIDARTNTVMSSYAITR